MGYSAQSGHVIFRTQTAPGTYNSDTGTAGVAMRVKTGGLGTNRELLIPDPEIGGGRDVTDTYLGTINNSGDYEFYVRLPSLVTLMNAVLGSSSLATATGVTTATITPSDASQLPFLSIEEKISNNFETFQYTDAVVNTLHLETEANGFLSGTAGIIAARQVAGATPTATPLFDTSPLTVGTNVIATYNSIQLPAKSFTFDINNNFEDTDFRLGSFYLSDLTPKRREITASFSIREKDKDLWRQATLGAAAATAPTGVPTKQQLVITANTYEIVSGAVTGSITITIPKFVWRPYNLTASGDDILESTLEGQAIRPVPGTPIATVVIKSAAPTMS